jgi:hypothetical protein
VTPPIGRRRAQRSIDGAHGKWAKIRRQRQALVWGRGDSGRASRQSARAGLGSLEAILVKPEQARHEQLFNFLERAPRSYT